MIGLIKVTGISMTPTLNDGDYIITLKPRTYRAGLIYVMRHERYGRIVKRAASIHENTVHFKSDNPEGSSGQITLEHITARAWLAVTPAGIKRL